MAAKKLLDQVTEIAHFRNLSLRTEATYRNWIGRFILFHHIHHPRELDADHDLQRGYGAVHLPYALERKYRNASGYSV